MRFASELQPVALLTPPETSAAAEIDFVPAVSLVAAPRRNVDAPDPDSQETRWRKRALQATKPALEQAPDWTELRDANGQRRPFKVTLLLFDHATPTAFTLPHVFASGQDVVNYFAPNHREPSSLDPYFLLLWPGSFHHPRSLGRMRDIRQDVSNSFDIASLCQTYLACISRTEKTQIIDPAVWEKIVVTAALFERSDLMQRNPHAVQATLGLLPSHQLSRILTRVAVHTASSGRWDLAQFSLRHGAEPTLALTPPVPSFLRVTTLVDLLVEKKRVKLSDPQDEWAETGTSDLLPLAQLAADPAVSAVPAVMAEVLQRIDALLAQSFLHEN